MDFYEFRCYLCIIMDKELIIFDLDGTLLDTIGDLAASVEHCLGIHGFPRHPELEYKKMVGHGIRNLVSAALPEEHRQDAFVDCFLQEFLDRYLNNINICTTPYPGITEVLETLQSKGYSLAIASNKIQEGVDKLMGLFFPDIHFAGVLGQRAGHPLKPDAGVIHLLMEKAGVSAQNTTMVGDSATDIRTARNAGVRSVAVSWGFRPLEDLAGADAIAGNAGELLSILLKPRAGKVQLGEMTGATYY